MCTVQVLVERLLSTCADIQEVFLLVREKKDVPPEKRLAQFKQCQVRHQQRRAAAHGTNCVVFTIILSTQLTTADR